MRVLKRFDTQLNADAVEIASGRVAVGCYQLVESTTDVPASRKAQSRRGRVWVLEAESLKQLACWEKATSGVLDLKWVNDKNFIAACADGRLLRFRVDDVGELNEASSATIFEAILLSIDFNTETSLAAVSASNGAVAVVSVPTLETVWSRENAHSYEAWVASMDPGANCVLSGGDDGALRIWDIRTEPHAKCVMQANAAHDLLGVTSICCIESDDHAIITGGYDNQLRFWDRRNLHRELKDPLKLSGAPWRIKPHPNERHKLLVPAMYAGAYVITMPTATCPSTLSLYEGHDSIVYGAAWMRLPEEDEFAALTCSFYDHALHMWLPSDVSLQ
eukprot:Plantae.Rhodophyta-Purpureofilum_apyrenoidigerum.ctg40583.p1 GENE.Plantae.Rhodophyta-Purpureofilum_apyrenoidigerum.ctg40583~~Plantae.Rhodophyta-Purpureofilum_apyrenoidigerum.ctg40583.p1  ORF type:complete len:333 (-),score=32.51 Plantae.Rhodophyta-Purpureofilum_apyrenoidigerum.ctg40583:116-1114(-)